MATSEIKQIPAHWIEVRRGQGSLALSDMGEGEFVTASGLHDGGYIVWKLNPVEAGERNG